MFHKKFLKFIEIWQKQFAFERTLEQQNASDAEGQPLPWYTYPAIEYLKQFDFSGKKIFEYGCANSSLFWAERALKVVSVEDNLTWYHKWQNEFEADNLEILFREGEAYENTIFETNEKFDVIVIDGVRRAESAKAAIQVMAEGGMIILDDSDRCEKSPAFRAAVQTLKDAGLLQVDFYGFCPMNIYPKVTSVFFSRNFNFPTVANFQPVGGVGGVWRMPRKQRKELYKIEHDLK